MMPDLDVGFGVRIPARELEVAYSRSGGPGGQNVNKVETRATVRLDVARSPSIPEWARPLLLEKLASRLTKQGEILVSSDQFRDQPRNLAAACNRLTALLHQALTPVKPRKATRPTRGSQSRRLVTKKRRGATKKTRGEQVKPDDD